MNSIASTLRGWASYEASKEIGMLREYFNITNLSISEDDMYTS
jgi:hypothetical protein